ncbi:AAA family ATPase [Clostridium sardiniense]|uniref:AAA family ATPase n=1 Tax=Clostridium sardiniense TaxID=29369 RepID=UPI0019579A45|nr:AAA family ATPase [Clostridium sardiniense]MBM7836477.1 hypothetical protein [Clostridium sardiniense]
MARRSFKKNQVKASILGYYYYIRGVEKAGKTTLFYEINEALYGNQDHGLLISMGKEDGYKTLPGIQVEVIDDATKIDDKGKVKTVKTAWKQLVELVDDLVLDKMDNETEIELLGIDTYDELCRLASAEVVRQSNKENPTKQCKSINAACGGFNGGFERFEQIVEEQLHRLRAVGYTLFVISHTKVRTIKEKGMNEDDSYQMLTTNLDSRFDNVIAHKADVIATIQVDKDIKDGKLLGTKRYIHFREDNFVKAGSRFKEIVEKVELSAPNFIKAIEDGIRASLRNKISDEDFEKKKQKDNEERKEKIEHIKEINEAITTTVDPEENEKIKEQIVAKWKSATQEQKDKAKEIMNKFNIKKLTEYDSNVTEGMRQVLTIL